MEMWICGRIKYGFICSVCVGDVLWCGSGLVNSKGVSVKSTWRLVGGFWTMSLLISNIYFEFAPFTRLWWVDVVSIHNLGAGMSIGMPPKKHIRSSNEGCLNYLLDICSILHENWGKVIKYILKGYIDNIWNWIQYFIIGFVFEFGYMFEYFL